MKIVASSVDSRNMSSLKGYIRTNYQELSNAFGPPTVQGSGDGKVSAEWILKIDGQIVTIYDYKEEGTPYSEYDWHVGGHSNNVLTILEKAVQYKNINGTVMGA